MCMRCTWIEQNLLGEVVVFASNNRQSTCKSQKKFFGLSCDEFVDQKMEAKLLIHTKIRLTSSQLCWWNKRSTGNTTL